MKYILSRQPRLVVRLSNEHALVQVVEAGAQGDRVITSAFSKELVSKYGWKGSCSNIPAAYLTGFIAGMKALKTDIKKAVLDIGLKRNSKGAKVFAALKGGIDAGLEVPHGEDIFPNSERLRGESIAQYAEQLSTIPEQYEKRFSQYLRRELKPQDLPSHFDEVRARIEKELK
jgi:large subunit ribosomal protein L18